MKSRINILSGISLLPGWVRGELKNVLGMVGS